MVRSKSAYIISGVLLTFTMACSLVNVTSATQPPEAETQPVDHGDAQSQAAGENITQETQPVEDTPAQEPSSLPLDPAGPWLLLKTGDSLLAVNPDGTGPITLASTAKWVGSQHLSEQIAPSGGRIAFLTTSDIRLLDDLRLNVFSVPDQQVIAEFELISTEYVPDPSAEWGDPALMAAHTLVDVSSFAWSPDGTRLAFMGIIEGETSDLYLHDFNSGETTRLTDGSSQGIRPSWSPDGRWIVHTGVSSLGTGAGFGMEGIWAAAADGSSVQALYPLETSSGDEIIHGWLSPQEFVVSTWNAVFGEHALRSYNIETGETRMIVEGPFTTSALDTRMGTVLYYVDSYSAQDPSDSGLFMVHIETGTKTILTDIPLRFTWDSSTGSYLIITEDRTYARTPRGAETTYPPEIRSFPAFPVGSDRWAAAQAGQDIIPGLWASTSDGSVLKLSSAPYTGVIWIPSGGLIAFGNPGLAYVSENLDAFTQTSTEPLLVGDAALMYGGSN